MTWARTRARANNASHIKQDSMGIGVNAAARIDREHSSCNAAIEKTQAELRLEVAVREKRRRELEFLEKGGDPLDFEFGDATLSSHLSTVSLAGLFSLSDSEANLKEKKLFFLQSKHFNHGTVVESKRGIDGYGIHQVRAAPGASRINGQVTRDCSPASVKDSQLQLVSSLGRLAKNNVDTTGNELRQIFPKEIPPNGVSVKAGNCLTSTVSHENRACSEGISDYLKVVVVDTVPENSANNLLESAIGHLEENNVRQGKSNNSEDNISVRKDKVTDFEVKTANFLSCSGREDNVNDYVGKTGDTSVGEQKINNLEVVDTIHISPKEDDINSSEVKAISSLDTPVLATFKGNNGREQIIGSQNQDSSHSRSEKPENRKRIRTNEDEILRNAEAIKAAKQCAERNPLPGPARRKSHWDFVLEEMAWMANDFMQERLWKTAAAAQVCRCAAKAAFWSRAEALARAANSNVSVKLESMDADSSSLPEVAPAVTLATSQHPDQISMEKRLPLENYAFRFFKNAMETHIASAPPTPDRQEPVSSWVDQESLHFLIPYGANEVYRVSIEDSWASNVAAYDRELQKQKLAEAEIEEEEFLATNMPSFANAEVVVKREESEGSDQTVTVKKKRKLVLKANIEGVEQSDLCFSEFLDSGGAIKGIPVKKLRTSGVSGRQRLEKLTGGHTKNLAELAKSSTFIDEENDVQKTKKGKSIKTRIMKKSTDSDEWLPEACNSPEKAKRKKDQFLGNKIKMMTEELSGSKKAKLSKTAALNKPTEFAISADRMKRTNLRKRDFVQVSFNQPGNGVPWSTAEDQAVVMLEHEYGSNWELLSDILNTNFCMKGQFRTPKDCKERHVYLVENMHVDRNGGIPKGSARMLLNRLQGPMEEDTSKVHLEQIIKAKKNHSQMKSHQREILQPHVTHLDVVSQIQGTHGRFLSPLELADEIPPVSGQSGAQHIDQGSGAQNKTIDRSSTSTSFSGPNREALLPKPRNIKPGTLSGKPGSHDHTRSSVDALEEVQRSTEHNAIPKAGQGQKHSRSIQEAPAVRNSPSCAGTSQQFNNGQQEQVRKVASLHLEDSRLEQQHRMQQMHQTVPQKQRLRDPLQYPDSPACPAQQQPVEGKKTIGVQEQRTFPGQHFNTHSRQSFQQNSIRKSGQVQTSASQQHQDHLPASSQATSFAEQHQQPPFPISRVSQHNPSVDPRIAMQQPNSQYNHQYFSGSGPSQAARLATSSNHSTHWRPGQNPAGIYRGNQMSCLSQVPPNSVDGVFQQPRFQNPGVNARSMKPMGAQRTMQAHTGVQFLPSPVAGGMRYQGFSGAQPNFRPVYTGKAWQQPHGGNPAFCGGGGGGGGGPERPIMPLTSTASMDMLGSTGDAGSATPSASCK